MLDGTVPVGSAQVTQVAESTSGFLESLPVMGHEIATHLRHMIFRSPPRNLGLRRVMAVQR